MSFTSLLNLLDKGIRADLLQTSQDAAANPFRITSLAMSSLPSTARTESYGWLGQPAQLEDMTNAPLVLSPLSETKYDLSNKTFGSSVGITRDDLADDQVQGFIMRARQLNQMGVYLGDKLGVDLLKNGTSSTLGLCYDGVSFFNDSHPSRGSGAGSGVQDNLLAGTGTTVAQLATDLTSALAGMLNLKAENGAPFHMNAAAARFAIVCPVSLWLAFKDVLGAGLTGVISQTSNVRFVDMPFVVIPSPELTDANDWYLLRTDTPVRPIFLQEREPLSAEMLGEGSDIWTKERKALWVVYRRCVGGYAHWQNAVKVVNS